MKSILKLFLCLTALLLCMSAVAMAETCTGAHEMEYEYNYNQHCGTCVNCGYSTGWDGHFTSCMRDTSECFGCKASDTEVKVVIVHSSFSEYKSDADGHWKECNNCGEKGYEGKHSAQCSDPTVCIACGASVTTDWLLHENEVEWVIEGKMHYQVCSGCGEIFYEGTHYAVCSAPNVCVECGATSNIDRVDHSFDWNNVQKDADTHWWICEDCGEKTNETEHYVNCQSPNTCLDCGAAVSNSGWVSHNYNWDKPEMNDTHHWWICLDCGVEADKGEHELLCNGTTCVSCGYAGTITNKYHSYMYLEEGHDATHHWGYCNKCEEYSYYWEHYPDEDGNCWCGQTGLFDCQHANVVTVSTIDATCSKGGFAVKICKDCGENLETFNTDPLSHKYETTTTPATCTAEGETKVACVNCGEVQSTEKLPKLAHEGWWSLGAAATCTTEGVKVWSCRYCDAPMGEEAIPATGHALTSTEEEAAITEKCANCDYVNVITKTAVEGATILVDDIELENAVKAFTVKVVVAEGAVAPETVTVTLTLTEEEVAALANTKLVLVEGDTQTELAYEVVDGKLVFTAAKLGTFAFVPAV